MRATKQPGDLPYSPPNTSRQAEEQEQKEDVMDGRVPLCKPPASLSHTDSRMPQGALLSTRAQLVDT
jgi:hypothetical protein